MKRESYEVTFRLPGYGEVTYTVVPVSGKGKKAKMEAINRVHRYVDELEARGEQDVTVRHTVTMKVEKLPERSAA